MKTVFFLFIGAAITATAANQNEWWKDPKTLNLRITQQGAASVLNKLCPNTQQETQAEYAAWINILASIGSGTQAWLEIAQRLRPAAVGPQLNDIDTAIGQAVVYNPKQVLDFIALMSGYGYYTPATGKYDSSYVDRTCGFINVEQTAGATYDTPAQYTNEINKREKALKTVVAPSLQPWVQICTKDLEKSRKNAPSQFEGPSKTDINQFADDYKKTYDSIIANPKRGCGVFKRFIQKYPDPMEFSTSYAPIAVMLLANRISFVRFISLARTDKRFFQIVLRYIKEASPSLDQAMFKPDKLESIIANTKHKCPHGAKDICLPIEQIAKEISGRVKTSKPNTVAAPRLP